MQAAETLLPVFLMMALGVTARLRRWITAEQKDGARKIVFGILFPVLIFNAIFTASLSPSTFQIVAYVTGGFILAYLIGKVLTKFTGEKYAKISPYLLTTCEGGNVALPLYTSIVGASYAINTVTFDMAGTIVAFVLVPIMVSIQSASGVDLQGLLKKICTNSFVIAVTLGLVLNVTGVYGILQNSAFGNLYTNAVSMIVSPVTGIILFSLGYDLKVDAGTLMRDITERPEGVDAGTLKPILKLGLSRILTGALIIAGFFLFFPALMQDRIYLIAVLLYFMCPTGFALPMQLTPLCSDESDEQFMSAFLSLFMIVTLAVYVLIAVVLV